MKLRIYVETTIPSVLAAKCSQDVIQLARQLKTDLWWESRREHFDLFVSDAVLQECAGGDPAASRRRMQLVENIPILGLTEEVVALMKRILRETSLPPRAATDALHIAYAIVHEMDFLLTWNCRHLANAVYIKKINDLCYNHNLKPVLICTPDELMES